MGKRRRTTEVRQAELTSAALRIVATRGIAALSTRSLADEVGLTTGAIFRHFATLDLLLDAVVARVEAVLDATYPDLTLPPVERLERFIHTRSMAVGQELGILRLVLSDQFHLALPKDGAARLGGCVQKTRTFVVTCLQQAQASGTVRSDVAPDALAPVVMGTIQMLALSPVKARRREAEASVVLAGLLALLRPTKAGPSPGRRSRS